MANTQKELNNRIAVELDKHCIQNEYAYLLLDQDKAIRDKYKWLFNLSMSTWIDLGVSIISAIIGFVSKLDWLLYIGGSLFIFFLLLLFIRFFNRKQIAKLLNAEHREKLSSALQRHSEYVDNLRLWFMEVGADKTTDNRTLKEIYTLFKEAAIKGNQTYNELSSLFGVMQEELHDKARNKAVVKLSQLVQFHIK